MKAPEAQATGESQILENLSPIPTILSQITPNHLESIDYLKSESHPRITSTLKIKELILGSILTSDLRDPAPFHVHPTYSFW